MQKFVSMSNKAGEKLKSGVGLWSQQSFQIVKMFLYFLKNVRDSLTRTKKNFSFGSYLSQTKCFCFVNVFSRLEICIIDCPNCKFLLNI